MNLPSPFVRLMLAAALLSLTPVFASPATTASAAPATDAGFTIEGQVQHSQHFTAEDLEKLPATKVSVSYVTGHGQESGIYSGVLLWTLLNEAVLIDGPSKGGLLRHVMTITGRDGYSVVLSAGELAPDFEGKSVIMAYSKDNQPLAPAEGIRLIVPGDKHGGRAVRDVVKIDIH